MRILGHPSSQARHEQSDQPSLHHIRLIIDLHLLRHPLLLLKQRVQLHILRLARKRRHLPLGPRLGKHTHYGDLVVQHGCRVVQLPRCGEGDALQVGEVERFVGAEEARVGSEGLAFVVAHVGPFSKVGLGDGFGPAETVSTWETGLEYWWGGGGLTVGFGVRGVCRS